MLMAALASLPSPLFGSLSAQTTIIRLGTLVPKGSRWHEILLNMGEEWKKASGGKIELKIYPGGEQGDEPEMVQKLRIKKLQAVALSGAGLSGIDPAVAALQVPMMLSSYEELDYVRDHISERLEKGLAQRGFIVLNWGDAGWVHFFTKQPALPSRRHSPHEALRAARRHRHFPALQDQRLSTRFAGRHRHPHRPANRARSTRSKRLRWWP